MDALLLARLQFAFTIGFHFLFPPISIGLSWLLVIMEGLGWQRKDEVYMRMGKFFGKLLALTFAVGVATGNCYGVSIWNELGCVFKICW